MDENAALILGNSTPSIYDALEILKYFGELENRLEYVHGWEPYKNP